MLTTILLSMIGSLVTYSAVKIGNKVLAGLSGFSLVLALVVGA